MKNIWRYVLFGCFAAIGGLFVAELAGNVFTGMQGDNAVILGICMYLCIVLITCTGIVICKMNDLLGHDQKGTDETGNESSETQD